MSWGCRQTKNDILPNIDRFNFSNNYFYCDWFIFNWQWLSNAVFEEHFSTSKRHRVILIAYAQQDQSRNTLMHLHTLLSKNTYRVFNFYLVCDLCHHSEILNRPGLIRFKPSSDFLSWSYPGLRNVFASFCLFLFLFGLILDFFQTFFIALDNLVRLISIDLNTL